MNNEKKLDAISAALFISAVLAVTLTAPAWAEDYPTATSHKLGRGVTNTALGWTEMLNSTQKIGDEHGVIAGLIWGPIDGLGNTIKRTAIGLYETATFPIITSKNNEPLMEPEFGAIPHDRAGYRSKDYTF